MGKVGKKKRSDAKKEVKRRRKSANYLRYGLKRVTKVNDKRRADTVRTKQEAGLIETLLQHRPA